MVYASPFRRWQDGSMSATMPITTDISIGSASSAKTAYIQQYRCGCDEGSHNAMSSRRLHSCGTSAEITDSPARQRFAIALRPCECATLTSIAPTSYSDRLRAHCPTYTFALRHLHLAQSMVPGHCEKTVRHPINYQLTTCYRAPSSL